MPRIEDNTTSVTLNPPLMLFWGVVTIFITLFVVGYNVWQGALSTPSETLQASQAQVPQNLETVNKALIERLYLTVLNNSELGETDLSFAPNFTYYEAGETVDFIKYQQYIKNQHRVYHDLLYKIEDMVAEDTQVVVRWVAGGTPQQTFITHPPSGQQQIWRGVTVWKISEAGIISGWTVYQ